MATTRPTIVLLVSAVLAASAQAPAPHSGPELLVKTFLGQSSLVGASDFAKLSPRIVSAKDHDGKKHQYSGVDLRDLLDQLGVPKGDAICGKEITDYVIAEAADGYCVVFSLTELDSQFGNTEVLIANKADGQPLSENEGPLRLVVPGDKRQARWIRMLKTLSVVRAQ